MHQRLRQFHLQNLQSCYIGISKDKTLKIYFWVTTNGKIYIRSFRKNQLLRKMDHMTKADMDILTRNTSFIS